MPSRWAHVRITVDFSSRHSSHDTGGEDESWTHSATCRQPSTCRHTDTSCNRRLVRIDVSIVFVATAVGARRAQTHGSEHRFLFH